jgi:O-antigen ligase
MSFQNAHSPPTLNPAFILKTRTDSVSLVGALFFLAAHYPLALVMREFSQVATLHALLVFIIGLSWALFGRKPLQVGFVGAYVTGAEVLWRMTDAKIPWEFGKYAVVIIFLAALLRVPGWKLPALPFLYFMLLLPSIAVTVANLAPEEARKQISFNLSGPLALMVSAWFFSHLKLSITQLYRLFLAALAPVVGISGVALVAVLTASNLNFGTEASSVASGGFGPNQVSAVLGLGALLAFWFVVNEKLSWGMKALVFGGMLLLAAQSALTFSRGGLYNAAGAVILAVLFLARDVRSRVKIVLLVVSVLVVGNVFIVPRLDQFTSGTILDRFQDTSLTGRDLIVKADLQTWQKNPAWGVGPGQSAELHQMLFRDSAAHTEFSRLLAEHGIPGLAALVLLIVMGVRNVRRAPNARSKAVAASTIGWSFLFMSNVAMRLVAPSFLFGLTFV